MLPTKRTYVILGSCLALAAIACGGEQKPATEQTGAAAPAGAPATGAVASATPLTPDPGGKVITVELYTDGNGNYFKPSEIHAKRGDVVRFVLKVGVHNVHFLADSNAAVSGYPAAPGDFLQLPGQTWDVAVSMPAGRYYFQCDPHAALGMMGHLVVE